VAEENRARAAMKVAILAGGKGVRMWPETDRLPKPMITVGDRPILWHIMQHYSGFGYREFCVALGYRGEEIKRYLSGCAAPAGDLVVDFRERADAGRGGGLADWRVELVETGMEAGTGARLRRLAGRVGPGPFMLTYGDAVADVDVNALVAFHRAHGRLATLTAVRPPARFGHLEFEGDRVAQFAEKPQLAEGWISGGYFVLEPGVLDQVGTDEHSSFERETLPFLAARGELMAYRHASFWQCMDTPRDRGLLEDLWARGDAPWKSGT
jgi:glucose-1-phosphate cytidylyltransferase